MGFKQINFWDQNTSKITLNKVDKIFSVIVCYRHTAFLGDVNLFKSFYDTALFTVQSNVASWESSIAPSAQHVTLQTGLNFTHKNSFD